MCICTQLMKREGLNKYDSLRETAGENSSLTHQEREGEKDKDVFVYIVRGKHVQEGMVNIGEKMCIF